jgi:hypothetical protein
MTIYNLEKKHINNTKLLVNRLELLEVLPKNGVVAELGVDTGDFSQEILNITNPSKLHLIDAWGSTRYNSEKKDFVFNRFSQEIENGLIEINVGLTTDVVNIFTDKFFDWIYIDSDHGYNVTIEELYKWESKIKDGGIISGHDYNEGNWKKNLKYGVIESVYEFCNEKNWEIIYITTERTDNASFAIKKIV